MAKKTILRVFFYFEGGGGGGGVLSSFFLFHFFPAHDKSDVIKQIFIFALFLFLSVSFDKIMKYRGYIFMSYNLHQFKKWFILNTDMHDHVAMIQKQAKYWRC